MRLRDRVRVIVSTTDRYWAAVGGLLCTMSPDKVADTLEQTAARIRRDGGLFDPADLAEIVP